MTRWYLIAAAVIGLSSCLCMSFFWPSSQRLLQRLLPSRILATVTMATETSTEVASQLSAAFVTVPGVEVAEKLASEIVQQKLAACVNVIPGITSVYEWEGKIEKDKEVILMIKTRTSKVDKLSEYVRKNHPFDVAEVISFPIQNGNLPYLQWLMKTVPE